tara:strand:+ start:132 stop:578 length:447 start_codon:yes stop_codon:yes gene_type:complete
MAVHNYTTGLRNVGSYQVSGTPWITGSASTTAFATAKTIRHTFPYVTKSITVINTGANEIRLHFATGRTFSADGITGQQTYASGDDDQNKYHYISIPGSSGSVTLDVKCKEVYLSNTSGGTSGYQMFAELTQIPTGSMFTLSGSGLNL